MSWRLTIALSGLLFIAILGLRSVADPEDATLVLFVVPIALCAIAFGTRGGAAAAALAIALLLGWDVMHQHALGPLGVATRAMAFLIVGTLLGQFVDKRRALEAKMERHFELSHDLFCTATFEGRFVDLNPAWEETLGYTREELTAQPFLEFVHPDDRDRTDAEAAKLAETGAETVSFRNRYRKADGGYLLLEWNARALPEEELIYATARDITVQQKAEEALQAQNDMLERNVRTRTAALQEARLETLNRLAVATEYRDDDTHQHTERVGRTAALLARELGLSAPTVALLRHAAPLHDVGKVGIPDSVLLKPGRLTDQEFELMKEHTEIGDRILADGRFPVLRLAQVITLTHHERWDGTGYPTGLSTEEIPLAGRITAVADVFDALTHDRPYKEAWPLDVSVAEIERLAGQHFDPSVVRAFAALEHRRLLENVEDYDLELPPPPLTTPTESVKLGAGREPTPSPLPPRRETTAAGAPR